MPAASSCSSPCCQTADHTAAVKCCLFKSVAFAACCACQICPTPALATVPCTVSICCKLTNHTELQHETVVDGWASCKHASTPQAPPHQCVTRYTLTCSQTPDYQSRNLIAGLGMQQRRFDFAGERSVSVLCREPPESQASRTLTWQLEEGEPPDAAAAAKQHAPAAVSAAATATGTATGPAAAADPDLIGLDIWPASLALCRYLVAHPELVVDQRVVELGAGGCCSGAHISSN